MDIAEIKRITDLVQKVNCEGSALVSEVAKEMGVKKTALMQFIEDNPKLFKLGEKIRRTRNTATNLGLAIIRAYVCAEDNPDAEEWLAKMQKKWEGKIYVGEQTYYGAHEYWFIPEDGTGKEKYYRNTKEKIDYLVEQGVIKKVSTGYGGFSDYYKTEVYLFNDEVKRKLRGIGWTIVMKGDEAVL